MQSQQLNTDERKHLRFARLAIYAFPILAGLLTVSIGLAADVMRIAQDQFVVLTAFIVNTFAAGVASAYVVSRQHPRERGKWWRAATSFLFALPVTVMSTIVFAACSALIVNLLGLP